MHWINTNRWYAGRNSYSYSSTYSYSKLKLELFVPFVALPLQGRRIYVHTIEMQKLLGVGQLNRGA